MPATPPDTTESYDVFISYSHADADWVWGWLVPRLKAEGLAVCTDRETFDLGVPRLVNMENAVAASRHTLLVLTETWVQSHWTQYETLLVQTDDPSGMLQRTLPVLRGPCTLPHRIAMLTHADLSSEHNGETEFTRLLDAIRGVRRLPNPLKQSNFQKNSQETPKVTPEPPEAEKIEPPKVGEFKPNPRKPEPPRKEPKPEPKSKLIIDGPTGRKKFGFRFPTIQLPPDYRWQPRLWQTLIWLAVAGIILLVTGWLNATNSFGESIGNLYLAFLLLEGLIFLRLIWIWWPHKKRL